MYYGTPVDPNIANNPNSYGPTGYAPNSYNNADNGNGYRPEGYNNNANGHGLNGYAFNNPNNFNSYGHDGSDSNSHSKPNGSQNDSGTTTPGKQARIKNKWLYQD